MALLGDFNTKVDKDGETWKGLIGTTVALSQNIAFLFYFYGMHGLTITNIISTNKEVHMINVLGTRTP